MWLQIFNVTGQVKEPKDLIRKASSLSYCICPRLRANTVYDTRVVALLTVNHGFPFILLSRPGTA